MLFKKSYCLCGVFFFAPTFGFIFTTLPSLFIFFTAPVSVEDERIKKWL